MWGAWATLQRQYAGLDCGVSLARVHQACIPPVANYGCELWGLRNMATRQARQREKLLMVHVNMLRSVIGARKSTPQALVLLESSRAPRLRCLAAAIGHILEQLARLPPTSLFRRIALDSVAQALLGTHNWASSLVTSLAAVEYTLSLQLEDSRGLIPYYQAFTGSPAYVHLHTQ